jgi:uncharacterized membrane protein
VFATNIFGQWWLRQWDRLLHKIPIVKVGLQLGQAGLGHAVLEQRQRLPRGGAGAVPAPGLLDHRLRHRQARRRGGAHLPGDYVSVYVPTTPNPTSGFFLMMPRADVVALDMSVDEALKYIISMGVVVAAEQDAACRAAGAKPGRLPLVPAPARRRLWTRVAAGEAPFHHPSRKAERYS